MFRLFALLIGYALGHIQTSYILGKTLKKIDIRDYGSHNAGMTNTLRVMGWKYAVIVITVDMLKAVAAYVICSALFNGEGTFFTAADALRGIIPGLYGAVGAILGHAFPVFMKFRGGKSIACGLGMIFAIDPLLAGILIGIALIIILLTRFLSLASINSSILFPFMIWMFGFELEAIIVCICIGIFLTYKHKDNISRMLKGTENVLFGKK
jgi:glycerol-3-phosphate acyltransferase PlsY